MFKFINKDGLKKNPRDCSFQIRIKLEGRQLYLKNIPLQTISRNLDYEILHLSLKERFL